MAAPTWQTPGALTWETSIGGASEPIPYPASIASGDLLVMVVHGKPNTNGGWVGSVTTPSGFTSAGNTSWQGGYGNSGSHPVADEGDTIQFWYYKEATGSESGTITVTTSAFNIWGAQIFRLTKSSGAWDVANVVAGGKTASGATLAAQASSNPGITVDDMLIGAFTEPTDVGTIGARFASWSITATSATMNTAQEHSDSETSTGTDMGAGGCYATCTAGTATAAPTLGCTISGTNTNARGPAGILRVRISSTLDATATPSVVARTATVYSPIVGPVFEHYDSGSNGAAIGNTDGIFDDGITGATSTITYSNAHPVTGSLGLYLHGIASEVNWREVNLHDSDRPLAYWREYFYIPSVNVTTANLTFLEARSIDGSTRVARIAIQASNDFMRMQDGTTAQGTGFNMSTLYDTLFRLEWELDRTNSDQTLRIFYGANLHGTTPDLTETVSYTTGSGVARMRIGATTAPDVNVDQYRDATAWWLLDWVGPETFPGVTVTPSVVAATGTVYSPTFTSSVSTAPSVSAGTATVYAPTSFASSVSVAPSVIAATGSVPTPGVGQSVSISPSVIAAVATVQTAVAAGSVAIAPSVIARTATVNSVTVEINEIENFDTGSDGASIGTTDLIFDQGADAGGGTWEYDNVRSITGTLSAKVTLPAAATSWRSMYLDSAAAIVHARAYIYMATTAIAGGNLNIFQAHDSGAVRVARLVITTAEEMRMQDDSTGVGSTWPYVFDQWNRVEWQLNSTANTQTFRVFYGANLHGTTPDVEIASTFASGSDVYDIRVAPFANTQSNASTIWYDSVGWRKSTWVGPETVTAADAVVTPSVVAATGNVYTPTHTSSVSVAPSVIAATATIQTAIPAGHVAVTPSVIARTGVVNAATITATALATPAVIIGFGTVQSPTFAMSAVATPAVIARTATTQTAIAAGSVAVIPTAITCTATVHAPTIGAGNTVAPSVVTGTGTVYSPTVTHTALATPSVIAAVGTTQSALAAGHVLATPSVIARTATVGTPTFTITALATPSVAARTATVQTPTFVIGQTVSPTVITGTATTYAPTAFNSHVSVSPSVIARTATTQTAIAAGSAQVSPTVIARTATVNTPTFAIGQTVPATVVAGTGVVQSPTFTSSVSVSPSVIARTATTQTAIAAGSALVPATVVARTATVHTPTITAGNNINVNVSVVAATGTVQTAAFTSSVSVTPSVVARTATTQTAVAAGSVAITPSVVARTATVETATASASSTLAATVVAGTATVYSPTVATTSNVSFSATVVARTATTYTPSVTTSGNAVVNATVVQATGAVGAPTLSMSISTTPTVVQAIASVPSAIAEGSANATPDVVQAQATTHSPAIFTTTVVAPPVVTATSTVFSPTVDIGTGATPSVVSATANVPTPGVGQGAFVFAITVAAFGDVPTPAISAGEIAQVFPDVVIATATVPEAVIQLGALITATVIEAVGSVPSPFLEVKPETVTATALVYTPDIKLGASINASLVEVTATVYGPTFTVTALATPLTVVARTHIDLPVDFQRLDKLDTIEVGVVEQSWSFGGPQVGLEIEGITLSYETGPAKREADYL